MLVLLLGGALAGAPQDTVTFTLHDAVRRALEVSPHVLAAEGAVAAPRGERAEASWPFPAGPVLEFERVRRTSPGLTTYDRALVLRQDIEIGGQSFARAGAAGKRIHAAEETLADARRLVALEARLAFAALALAERRAALVDSAAQFGERLAEVTRRQLDAGEINLLEHNVAVLDAARQRSAADRADAERLEAAAEVGRVLGLEPGTALRTAPLPPFPDRAVPSLDSLLRTALAGRPDYVAADWRARAAGQDATAATLDGWIPALQLGAIGGEEAGTDDLLGFSIGVTVPLFRRNQGARGEAAARRSAAAAELEAVRRAVQADVEAALARYILARRAERRFAEEVLRAATENVTLTERAFAEGKVGIADVVVLRSTAVAAQLEYLEVLADAYEGWFRLAAAVSASPEELTSLTGEQP
jgi:cobalt-zinc-cadmium efflux system outer membrane protein